MFVKKLLGALGDVPPPPPLDPPVADVGTRQTARQRDRQGGNIDIVCGRDVSLMAQSVDRGL